MRNGHEFRPRHRRFRRPPSQGASYAALDLGTNNCRLLVAEPTGEGFRVVDAFSRIVRLGEGLAASGRLSDAAIDRTVRALKICAGKMQRHRIVGARNVATEACRKAVNCDQFVDQVRAESGLELEIISTGEEARLALAGCAPLLSDGVPFSFVFDIGGGSTELIWLHSAHSGGDCSIIDSLSLPIGVVNFAERHGGDRFDGQSYGRMVDEIVDLIEPFEARNEINRRIASGSVQMLGTSGTVTTLASVHMGLHHYDRTQVDGSYLDFDQIDAASRRLAAMDYRARAAMPCIGPERADLVVAGTAILDAICRLWPVGRLRVADRGLREGILMGLMKDGRVRAQ